MDENSGKKIRVLIADDQTILAEGIKSVLETDAGLETAGIACDGADALEKCRVWRPDVVLMDIRMPNMNGVVATQRIKSEFPDTKVVVLTTFDDSDYILNAINHGASGYLLKDISSSALIDAVKNAYAGDTILPAKIAKRIADAAKDVTASRELRLKRAFLLLIFHERTPPFAPIKPYAHTDVKGAFGIQNAGAACVCVFVGLMVKYR